MGEGGGPSFRTSVVADYRASAWRRRLALAGVLAWLAYEWGPGNEAVTPWIVLRIIGSTNESAAVVPVATAVGFGFTLFQQTLSGLTALSGFSMFTQTTQSAWEYLSDGGRKDLPRWATMSAPGRAAVVFTLGTTAVALTEIATSGEVGVRRHLRAVLSSALLCAGLVGFLAGFAGTLALIGRRVGALSAATQLILRLLGNPLVWLALAATLIVSETLQRRGAPPGAARIEGRDRNHG